jgi:hypothetical protein
MDPKRQTFRINGLVVEYKGAEVDGSLADGFTVTVEGPKLAADGSLSASRVEASSGSDATAGSVGQVEGLITNFASSSYFEVDGQAVVVDSHTRLKLHVPLGLNVAVRVKGAFDNRAVLVASELQKYSNEVQMTATSSRLIGQSAR